MEYQELVNWIRLINSNGVGPITFYKLMEKYQNAESALKQISEHKTFSDYDAKQEIEKAYKNGIKIISIKDKEYPDNLKELEDAPPLLYTKGMLSLLNHPVGVAVVGARNADVSSRKIASRIANDLTNSDVLIISGMARGIDSAAHKGAMYAKDQTGPTVAVLGTGVDVPYPQENIELYEQICEQGLVVSEYLLGTPPHTSNFPRRNRLVSALSSAVLVVEANLNSGSLITARLGLEQGKDVFAVPSSPIYGRSSGTNRLIKEGAVLTESADDILDVLRYTQNFKIKKFEDKNLSLSLNVLDKAKKSDNIPIKTKSVDLQNIISLIPPAGIDIDELIRLTGGDTYKVMAQITELEIDDIVERKNTNTLILKH